MRNLYNQEKVGRLIFNETWARRQERKVVYAWNKNISPMLSLEFVFSANITARYTPWHNCRARINQ